MSRIIDISGTAVMLDNDVADEIERLRAERDAYKALSRDMISEADELRARIAELEYELNPDPEAHLMGWAGDDE